MLASAVTKMIPFHNPTSTDLQVTLKVLRDLSVSELDDEQKICAKL
jgi:hypothetical protein